MLQRHHRNDSVSAPTTIGCSWMLLLMVGLCVVCDEDDDVDAGDDDDTDDDNDD